MCGRVSSGQGSSWKEIQLCYQEATYTPRDGGNASVAKGRIRVGRHILHYRDPRALCGSTVTGLKGNFRLEGWRKAARRPEEWQGDLPCGAGSVFRGGEEGGWFREVGEDYSARSL